MFIDICSFNLAFDYQLSNTSIYCYIYIYYLKNKALSKPLFFLPMGDSIVSNPVSVSNMNL